MEKTDFSKYWKKTGKNEWTNENTGIQINIHWSAFGWYISGIGSIVKPFSSESKARAFAKKYMKENY